MRAVRATRCLAARTFDSAPFHCDNRKRALFLEPVPAGPARFSRQRAFEEIGPDVAINPVLWGIGFFFRAPRSTNSWDRPVYINGQIGNAVIFLKFGVPFRALDCGRKMTKNNRKSTEIANRPNFDCKTKAGAIEIRVRRPRRMRKNQENDDFRKCARYLVDFSASRYTLLQTRFGARNRFDFQRREQMKFAAVRPSVKIQ